MEDKSAKYQQLANQGASPAIVYQTARADGLNLMESIKLLRELYGLSLKAAKEVTVTAGGHYRSLSDYQASLIPSIEKALNILEQEANGKTYAAIRWHQTLLGYALLDATDSGYVGDWDTFDSPQLSEFLAAIKSDGGVEIEFGEPTQRGVIETNPASTGKIVIKVS